MKQEIISLILHELGDGNEIQLEKFCKRYLIPLETLKSILKDYQDYIEYHDSTLRLRAKIDFLLKLASRGYPVNELLRYISWREFEDYVCNLLKKYGFNVRKKVRFKACGRRFEIDVLAVRDQIILLLECKFWRRIYSRRYSLNMAAHKHIQRAECFRNVIFRYLKEVVGNEIKIIPLIVSFYETDLNIVEDVRIPIVPVSMLRSFLIKLDSMEDYISVIRVYREGLEKFSK
ncbi:MAG: hypothetical protein DRJ47_04135 [Thermoprotei archaeon]|nr:MAG: hypothetical protein DRJ47_04135 [Thermoprotei archaeon]